MAKDFQTALTELQKTALKYNIPADSSRREEQKGTRYEETALSTEAQGELKEQLCTLAGLGGPAWFVGKGDNASPAFGFRGADELTLRMQENAQDGRTSLLLREGLYGAAYLVDFSKDGEILSVSSEPVTAEKYLDRFGPAKPEKPNFFDHFCDWVRSIFSKDSRDPVVKAYEDYQSECKTMLQSAGYEAKPAEKNATANVWVAPIHDRRFDGDIVTEEERQEEDYLDMSVMSMDDDAPAEEVPDPVKTSEMEYIANVLRASNFGYKLADDLNDKMCADMANIASYHKPRILTDRFLARDWEYYTTFAQSIYRIAEGSEEIRNRVLPDLYKNNALQILYDEYKQSAAERGIKLDLGDCLREIAAETKTNPAPQPKPAAPENAGNSALDEIAAQRKVSPIAKDNLERELAMVANNLRPDALGYYEGDKKLSDDIVAGMAAIERFPAPRELGDRSRLCQDWPVYTKFVKEVYEAAKDSKTTRDMFASMDSTRLEEIYGAYKSKALHGESVKLDQIIKLNQTAAQTQEMTMSGGTVINDGQSLGRK